MKSSAWSGWIGFTGCLVLVIGIANFIEGLIAVIRGQYYVLTSSQVIVFDVKTWGWIMIIWGIIVTLAGLGLLAGAGWARWFTIIVGIAHVLHAARLPRRRAVPAVGADGADADRDHALRPARPLGRRGPGLSGRDHRGGRRPPR